MLIFIANVIMKGIRGSVWNHLSQNQVFGKIKCRENSSYYVFIIVEILFNISVLFQLWQNILGIKIEAVCKWITAFPNTSFTDMNYRYENWEYEVFWQTTSQHPPKTKTMFLNQKQNFWKHVYYNGHKFNWEKSWLPILSQKVSSDITINNINRKTDTCNIYKVKVIYHKTIE